MSRTPAAELARIKVRYSEWRIRAVEDGRDKRYTAQRTSPDRPDKPMRIHARTVAELGAKLAAAEEQHHLNS